MNANGFVEPYIGAMPRTASRDVLEVLAHVGEGHPGHALLEQVGGESTGFPLASVVAQATPEPAAGNTAAGYARRASH